MLEPAGQNNVSPLEERTASRARTVELEMRRLLDKLPAGAYTCDPEGLITYFNPHALQLWGRAPRLNDPIDRFCGSFRLYSGEDGEPISHDQCWMALALQTGNEYNGHEIVIERPDGRRLTVLAHANPIRNESGRLLGALNVLVDISDRKNAEDTLKEADRYKNEFLATLAHELRNPLAPICNAVQILKLEGTAASEKQWAVGVIDRQMQQMSRLIDDLLDVARITGNRLDLRKDRVEVSEFIHTAVEISRPLIETYGHELVISIPTDSIVIDGDSTRLAQVVSNLLNNAAKYTERGGLIRLSAERHVGEAVITVQDNGIGIPTEMLPRMFEMFMQAEHSLDRAQGGLGIGLTLAKRLVTMHGGTITAYSDGKGKGSKFTVRLPLMSGTPESLPRSSQDTAPVPARVVSSLRILVVDDNRDSATNMAARLRFMGHDMRTSYDGQEAVTIAKVFRPDVILFDIDLPASNGYNAARTIRQQPWGKKIVLVATTEWGQATDRHRSKDAGFDYHLAKPVDSQTLLQVVGLVTNNAGESLVNP